MNSFKETMNQDIATRQQLRGKLMEAFETYHRRKRRIRVAVASVSCVCVFLGAGYFAMRSTPPQTSDDRIAHRQAIEPPLPQPNERSATAAPSERSRPPVLVSKQYEHMDLKILSEDELKEAISETSSEWFIVMVDGEPQAFSKRALESHNRVAPRTRKN